MKARNEQMEDWIGEEFRKAGSTPEHCPVFAEIFQTVFNSILNDNKIDALDSPNQLLDEDEPEWGTVQQFIEEETPKFFRHYLTQLDAGHSREFARIFALKVHELCDDTKQELEQASRAAFEAIRISWDCAMSNPAYAEAHAVCLHQGRSVRFADKCAEYLFDADLSLSRAQAKADTYEKTLEARLAKGYPLVRATGFAEYMVRSDLSGDPSHAEAFARVYEEQASAGKSHSEAYYYADVFLDYYSRFCGDWEESESEGDNDRARIHTEGHLRVRSKGFDPSGYAEEFASNYATMPKRDNRSMDEWLAVAEFRTDIAMKARSLNRAHRFDKICDHGTVYLNLETQRTAGEMGGWEKRGQLGVSIAVTISSQGPRVFTEDEIPQLAGVLAHAERVVGYNLRNFDLKVLAGYAGFSTGKARIFDLLDEVERAAGCRVSLQALASATLGTTLSPNSLDMVKYWKEGRVLEVIEGCSNDVFAIKALDEHARERGELFYCPHGSQERRRIAVTGSRCATD